MAKRRWSTGRRLAYGLGKGLSGALSDISRNRMAERSAERVARRQEEGDIRTAGYARSAAEQLAKQKNLDEIADLLPQVSEGKITPDAVWASMQARGMDGMFPSEFGVDYAGTGEVQQEAGANAQATGQALQSLRPPMRRKLESTVGEKIGSATSPEQLLPDDIMGQLLAADDRVVPDDSEPGMRIGGIRPEAYEYQVRAEDKQRALLQKPTNVVSGVDPVTGQSFTRKVSDETLGQGVVTSPTPEQAGVNKGMTEGTADVTNLGISGDAEAQQAGKVAGIEAGARERAQIQAKLDNAQALIDYDVRLATSKLGVVGAEVDTRKYAEQIAEAREAASKAAPVVAQIQAMWLNAQPVLEQWSGMTGRTGLQSYESMPASWKNQAINNYDGLVDAVRPLLARAFGQTGNPAIMEQVWAKYVPTYAEALRPDDALRKLARLETLLLSQVQIAMVTKERGTALTIGDIEAIVEPRIESAYQGLKQQSDAMRVQRQRGRAPGAATPPVDLPDTTFIVTPTGIQLAPPPRPQ